MVKQFKDYFSKQADNYANYRPHYPEALFEYLATQVTECKAAWDCATGNGQVALGLTSHFHKIYATDASEKQISYAFHHDKIKYSLAVAEKVGLANKSIDLITVAEAVHWFNLEQFYQEVQRISKPGGIIAIWGYWYFHLLREEEHLKQMLRDFLTTVFDQFGAEEIKILIQKYQTIPFPFAELKTPLFTMECQWNMEEFLGYLNSVSAVQKMISVQSHEPMLEFSKRLVKAWGDPERKILFQWPLHMRVGRIN
ncbi:class I SAM-dependent methyltransferase [Moorena bouillonii]|uniref:Methyltransferase type 11 domain-containing protein n=1 Tax=Moorena bouillonii PNG TaxID=568701 RepID=A0A1U7N502_9CYAN|nr:class I SAM-dependent methyltransferase [Moorena bouillonii]OLT61033.1 hypothetical protein BJP37_20455 [Moorena bouillonii PNG]